MLKEQDIIELKDDYYWTYHNTMTASGEYPFGAHEVNVVFSVCMIDDGSYQIWGGIWDYNVSSLVFDSQDVGRGVDLNDAIDDFKTKLQRSSNHAKMIAKSPKERIIDGVKYVRVDE